MHRRTPALLVTLLVATLIAAGCGGAESVTVSEGDTTGGKTTATTATTGGPAFSSAAFDDAERERAGCGVVEQLPDHGNEHTGDPAEEIEFAENPPASGTHYQVALDWGVYDDEQPESGWVHNLEHGHVVILHRDVEADALEELLELREKDRHHIVVIPRAKNPRPGFYFMAWRTRLYCRDLSAAALQMFVDEYRDKGPELIENDPEKVD